MFEDISSVQTMCVCTHLPFLVAYFREQSEYGVLSSKKNHKGVQRMLNHLIQYKLFLMQPFPLLVNVNEFFLYCHILFILTDIIQ